MNRQNTRDQIRAAAVLTAAYVAASAYPVPANCGRVTIHVVYTRNGASTTGYPSIKLQWKSGANVVDGNSLSGGTLVVPEEYPIGPTAATIATPVMAVVPDGVDSVLVSVKETGDTTNLGTCQLLAAKGDLS